MDQLLDVIDEFAASKYASSAARLLALIEEIERLRTSRTELLSAAQAVVDRWDTPLWKDAPATAEYIGRLRSAIAKAGT